MSPAEASGVRPIVQRALADGCMLSVSDGEEWTLKRCTDRDRIMAALGTTEGDQLNVRDEAGVAVGWIQLVYGNAPDEVVSDCSDNARILAIVGE